LKITIVYILETAQKWEEFLKHNETLMERVEEEKQAAIAENEHKVGELFVRITTLKAINQFCSGSIDLYERRSNQYL
jgi:hypothetical protein